LKGEHDGSKAKAFAPAFCRRCSDCGRAHRRWRVRTIQPSGYDSLIGWWTPHIHFDIKGRQARLITQMYFTTNSKDALCNEPGEDAVTAMAKQETDTENYRWDIVLFET